MLCIGASSIKRITRRSNGFSNIVTFAAKKRSKAANITSPVNAALGDMRAFKHTSEKEEAELACTFPTYRNFEWQDDESFIKLPISIWGSWLKDLTDDVDNFLWGCSAAEQSERELKFCNLSAAIINHFNVYGYFHNQDKLKKVRSKTQLISDIYRAKELERTLFIPSQEAIYFQTHDYTAWLYLRNKEKSKTVISLVEQCGLKFIK